MKSVLFEYYAAAKNNFFLNLSFYLFVKVLLKLALNGGS